MITRTIKSKVKIINDGPLTHGIVEDFDAIDVNKVVINMDRPAWNCAMSFSYEKSEKKLVIWGMLLEGDLLYEITYEPTEQFLRNEKINKLLGDTKT